MIKCFLVPMTEPPYSKEKPRMPKYVDEIKTNWTGIPFFNKSYFLIKANGTAQQLLTLQNQQGVYDFPNVDEDRLSSMPNARRIKNRAMYKLLGLNENEALNTRQFINLLANSETMHGWDKDKVQV